ncbi:hypothetical protein MKX03_014041 [Papaver bracteatum]|nr:hypothetical protein MKX03_014041 [Papaver bracteatum]
MIKGKILLSTTEKPSSEELGSLKLDVLEKRIRLCNDETEQDCLPEGYDPFLNGTRRGSEKKKKKEDWIWINKFHNILPTNYQELEEKKEKFEGKYFLTEEGKLNSENRTKYLFDAVTPDRHYQRIIKESIGIKEIRKEVPQWSYKLITSLEQQDGTILEETAEDHEIRSRKANHVVIFTDTERTNSTTNTNDEVEEVFVLRYSQESDFRRDIIKGSMRAQRRKTVIWEPIYKKVFFSADTSRIWNLLFKNWMIKSTEFKNSSFEEEAKEKDKKRKKKGEENDRLAVAESWDTTTFFFKTHFKRPRKKNKKKKTKSFLGLRVLKEKTKGFLKDSKEKESWTHKKDFFQKKKE